VTHAPKFCILQRTFMFKTENDKKVKEDVGADVKENCVRYHLKDDDSEVWVINDFNRVSKLNTFCFLLILILLFRYG